MITAEASVLIPFHDIDIMNIAWHGHYLKYFEIGRTALMSQLQLDWQDLQVLGYAMPVVDVAINYRRPLQYGTNYLVHCQISEINYPELRIDYKISDRDSAALMCRGHTRQVYVEVGSDQVCFSVPEDILSRFKDHG